MPYILDRNRNAVQNRWLGWRVFSGPEIVFNSSGEAEFIHEDWHVAVPRMMIYSVTILFWIMYAFISWKHRRNAAQPSRFEVIT